MTLDEIRNYRDRRPFDPFEIVLVDGRVFRVEHPEFILVPPSKGTWVFVAARDGHVEHINTVVISSLRPAPHRQNGRGRRRSR